MSTVDIYHFILCYGTQDHTVKSVQCIVHFAMAQRTSVKSVQCIVHFAWPHLVASTQKCLHVGLRACWFCSGPLRTSSSVDEDGYVAGACSAVPILHHPPVPSSCAVGMCCPFVPSLCTVFLYHDGMCGTPPSCLGILFVRGNLVAIVGRPEGILTQHLKPFQISPHFPTKISLKPCHRTLPTLHTRPCRNRVVTRVLTPGVTSCVTTWRAVLCRPGDSAAAKQPDLRCA